MERSEANLRTADNHHVAIRAETRGLPPEATQNQTGLFRPSERQ